MTFHVLTLFPEMVMQAASHSVLGRAVKSGIIAVNCVNIRDFAVNDYGQVDDTPYGGGAGMVMMAPPIYDAFAHVQAGTAGKPHVIYLSPQGKPFTQQKAQALAAQPDIVLLCGHYEGVDERVIEAIVDEEISIGDYVLTGGEPAALVVMDAVSRLVPGVLGKEASHQDESFARPMPDATPHKRCKPCEQCGACTHSGPLLEYPHYTRPAVFMGKEVPQVLLSGHHGRIETWRRKQALERTRTKRPDL